ncbi:hypothetical protein B566_EDAN005142 [Ephemera danica]|nr:hypothetical protein B566_EDAN005142 [Ephemera danica]
MEMTETHHRGTNVHRLLQTSTESLEVLDAKVLAARAASQFPALTRPSTPGSFVDLEWELEALQTSTMTQCSRVSSPPSLEWDLVDCELAAAGHEDETEQLISEIERLTQRALQETGFTLL